MDQYAIIGNKNCLDSKMFFFLLFFLDEQLHVVYLEPAPREKCEEESEVGAGTICTQEKSNVSDCNVST